jgi:hypothetical protein
MKKKISKETRKGQRERLQKTKIRKKKWERDGHDMLAKIL